LPAEGAAGRDELICELIKIDLEYRWEKGQGALVESYLLQFPQLSSSEATVLELIREELQVRRFQDRSPMSAELKERFPDRDFDWDALCAVGSPHSIGRRDTPHGSGVSSTLMPGHKLAKDADAGPGAAPTRLGRFKIREVLGKGGFATVYRAWDPELERDTAIKVPAAPLLIDQSIKLRLLREATSAARLRHPGIVTIHEVSKDESCPFIVYEFIPGPTLAQVMQQTTPSPQQAAQWTACIAEALAYAHANGIVSSGRGSAGQWVVARLLHHDLGL
jgi:serine/threonine protein kinase